MLKDEFETILYIESCDGKSSLFSNIKQNKFKSFEDNNVKAVVEKSGKQVEIAYQRDILGILVSHHIHLKLVLTLTRFFTYPLAPVSIPLCTPDRQNLKTAKSKLYDAVMSDLNIINESTLHEIPNLETYYLDLDVAVGNNRNEWYNKRFGMGNIADGTKTIQKYIPGI